MQWQDSTQEEEDEEKDNEEEEEEGEVEDERCLIPADVSLSSFRFTLPV